MHELGIMTGVLDTVLESAQRAGALKVTRIDMRVGEMTEAIDDAMRFAFEAISENTLCEGAELHIVRVQPKSLCLECGTEFQHDRFHRECTECGGLASHLIEGRELQIESIEVDLPDDEDGVSAEDAD